MANENRHLELSIDTWFAKNGVYLGTQTQFWIQNTQTENFQQFLQNWQPTSAALKNHKNSQRTPNDLKLMANEYRHLELSIDTWFAKNGVYLGTQKQFWNQNIRIKNFQQLLQNWQPDLCCFEKSPKITENSKWPEINGKWK